MAEEKIAVVTGGNRGIGLEVCRQLAKKGYRVFLTGRQEKAGAKEAGTSSEQGLPVEYHQLDVSDPASVHRLGKFIGARASFGATVTVEMGARGETNRFTVEAPGMAGGGGPRDNWVTSGPAAVIPASEPGVRVNGPAPDAGQRFPKLTRPASAIVVEVTGSPANQTVIKIKSSAGMK